MQGLQWHRIGSLLFIFKASTKFQGHLGQKIYKMFADCKSSLNSQMAMKWCMKLEVNLFMATTGDAWIIPSFQVWDYVLHVEHVTHVIKLNSLRPGRNEQHFSDDIFKPIFFNENVWISIKISLKFVPKGPINNIPALVQIMAWRRSGNKPLSEAMMVSLTTHICVTRPQWVNVV